MNPIFSNCVVSDAQALAENNVTAWWDDPSWNMLWHIRTLQYVIDGAAARGAHRLLQDRDRTRHMKAVDPATGRVVGYVRWEVPVGCEGDWLEMQTPDVTEAEREVYRRRYEAADWSTHEGMGEMDDPVHQIQPRIMKGRTFLSLEYIAVHPEFQGRGIASMLVRAGLDVAQKHGWDVFVFSNTPEGRKLYERSGFVMVEQVLQDTKKYHGTHVYELTFFEKRLIKDGGAS